ncbi:copper transport protein ATOX1 isoform 2-T2 [Hipposideros larvatus]
MAYGGARSSPRAHPEAQPRQRSEAGEASPPPLSPPPPNIVSVMPHEFSVDMTCEGCSNAVTRVLNKLGGHPSFPAFRTGPLWDLVILFHSGVPAETLTCPALPGFPAIKWSCFCWRCCLLRGLAVTSTLCCGAHTLL